MWRSPELGNGPSLTIALCLGSGLGEHSFWQRRRNWSARVHTMVHILVNQMPLNAMCCKQLPGLVLWNKNDDFHATGGLPDGHVSKISKWVPDRPPKLVSRFCKSFFKQYNKVACGDTECAHMRWQLFSSVCSRTGVNARIGMSFWGSKADPQLESSTYPLVRVVWEIECEDETTNLILKMNARLLYFT